MKKKGFTLIELLAVIVILAVIALISVPIILNVVEKARKGAFEDSAYGIVDAAKLYYTELALAGGNISETFTFPNDTKLKISGTKPTGGSVILDEKGKIELAIHNGKWCAIKSKNEEKVTITDYSMGNCGTVEVEDPNVPETCFTVNESDPGEITGYTCNNKSIVIPNTINGVEIKKIGEYVFKEKGITSVTIPEGITSIGHTAFEKNQLTSVEIPNSVKEIGASAFRDNQLTNVKIPEGITEISSGIFYNNLLTSVTIPESVTYIGIAAFYNNQLTSIIIPKNVTYIGTSAFRKNQLSNLVISEGVTMNDEDGENMIEGMAFASNQLTEVVIPNGVVNIWYNAFNDNLFPNDQAFVYPKNAEGEELKHILVGYRGAQRDNIVIPNNVTIIDHAAFDSCSITNVTIPEGVTRILSESFNNNQLTEITIPSSVTEIGRDAFLNNQENMRVIINKAEGSITGSPWGARSVQWVG